jgi:hypothetical protein
MIYKYLKNRFMGDALGKLAFKKREQTPSEKMQDELEPIMDEPNYRVGDFLDEVRAVEKMNKIKNK